MFVLAIGPFFGKLTSVPGATVATVIGTSHKRILFLHKSISFIDFGEAPLQYMLFFDS
jgi:hypothetical protein